MTPYYHYKDKTLKQAYEIITDLFNNGMKIQNIQLRQSTPSTRVTL